MLYCRKDRDGEKQVGFGIQCCDLCDSLSHHGLWVVLILWPCYHTG